MKREFQIDFLRRMGLAPHHYLVDIGCGTLRGGIPLIEYLDPGHYFGIERQGGVLAEGQRELREAGLVGKGATLIRSESLASLTLERQFDFLWGFSVLIHMSDQVLEECMAFAAAHLRPSGVLYANVNIGAKDEGHWEGFPVVSRAMGFYATVARRHGMEVADLGSLESLGHRSGQPSQDQQRMLAFRTSPNPAVQGEPAHAKPAG